MNLKLNSPLFSHVRKSSWKFKFRITVWSTTKCFCSNSCTIFQAFTWEFIFQLTRMPAAVYECEERVLILIKFISLYKHEACESGKLEKCNIGVERRLITSKLGSLVVSIQTSFRLFSLKKKSIFRSSLMKMPLEHNS